MGTLANSKYKGLEMLPDRRCFPSCYCSVLGEPSCAPESSQYKDTLDVFYKVTRQALKRNKCKSSIDCAH
ncbi:hypothetical protein Tco_1398237, partial [Tanacetum coccineum]